VILFHLHASESIVFNHAVLLDLANRFVEKLLLVLIDRNGRSSNMLFFGAMGQDLAVMI
jgi:hypothetical protein